MLKIRPNLRRLSMNEKFSLMPEDLMNHLFDTTITPINARKTHQVFTSLKTPHLALNELDLTKLPISDSFLIELVKCCPNLLKVNVEYCFKVTDKGIMGMADHCPRVTEFVFGSKEGGCDGLTTKVIPYICLKMPQLKKLRFYDCSKPGMAV